MLRSPAVTSQATLARSIARIRRRLAAAARPGASPSPTRVTSANRRALPRRRPALPGGLAVLADRLGLSPFECDVLLLCIAWEVESDFAALCAAAQGSPAANKPTFGLALACLAAPHWDCAAPDRPLRYFRLLHLEDGPLMRAPLRLDEAILHFVFGRPVLDVELRPYLTQAESTVEQRPSRRALAAQIAGSIRREQPPCVVLSATAGQRGVFQLSATALGVDLFILQVEGWPTNAADCELYARLCARLGLLNGTVFLIEVRDLNPATHPVMLALCAIVPVPIFFAVRDPGVLPELTRELIRFEMAEPDSGETRDILSGLLEASGRRVAEPTLRELDEVALHFALEPEDLRGVLRRSTTAGGDLDVRQVRQAARLRARARMDDLAQRVDVRANLADLVLPDELLRELESIVIHVRERPRVYRDWGFGEKLVRGLGVSALFAGESGTGKTMAAEALASRLDLDLYRVDLSSVVSKYIGETEKHLRRVFDAAQAGGGILLFDEADALFGKRTEVRDSHDRYANQGVSYLLQRMESYRGLAILTTNLQQAFDTAFLRRLRFILHFPFPDFAQRSTIWRGAFPRATPLDTLDFDRLARLPVPGGVIRNLALAASFLAASEDTPVTMRHLGRAVRSEFTKLQKTVPEDEVARWS